MRAKRVPKEQQFQLIMECRSSGLSDYQWCKENDIHPSTFYTWIARFRKEGYPEIPAPLSRESNHKATPQEAVKLELAPYEHSCILAQEVEQNACINEPVMMMNTATVEILANNASFRFTNDVNPNLLETVLRAIGDYQ